MIKLGLTGNICSGKSFAEDVFRKNGIPVIDADEIVHNLLDNDIEIINQVQRLFAPDNVIDENKKINRKAVGKLVFGDDKKRKELEQILHPVVIERIQTFFKEQEKNNKKAAVASLALLFEANLTHLFDKIVMITVDKNLQLQRLLKRNNLTEEQALARISSQLGQEEKIKKSDFVINNSKTTEIFQKNIEFLINQL